MPSPVKHASMFIQARSGVTACQRNRRNKQPSASREQRSAIFCAAGAGSRARPRRFPALPSRHHRRQPCTDGEALRRDRIVIDPAIAHGKLVIRGTRVPVAVVLGSLAGGMTLEEVGRSLDPGHSRRARLCRRSAERGILSRPASRRRVTFLPVAQSRIPSLIVVRDRHESAICRQTAFVWGAAVISA